MAGHLARHVFDRDQIAADLGIDVDHLLEAAGLGHDQIVGEQHGEGLVVNEAPRAPDRVAQPERFLLAGVIDPARSGQAVENFLELLHPAALFQRLLKLDGVVEVIFHRRLAAPGHQDELLDPGVARFLDRVLDKRLVHDRQHFLRQRLGRGQKACAETGHGKNGLLDGLDHRNPLERKAALLPYGQRRRKGGGGVGGQWRAVSVPAARSRASGPRARRGFSIRPSSSGRRRRA